MKPTLFIGSSREALPIAEAIYALLECREIEPTLWTQDVFRLNSSGLESLMAASKSYDYACFVLSRDDVVVSRGRRQPTTRDNVVFELGLFLGALGRDRVFVVYDASHEPRLPSDLKGIFFLSYDGERAASNRKAALTTPSAEIVEIVRRGSVVRDTPTHFHFADSRFKIFPLDAENSRWHNLTERLNRCDKGDTVRFISITGKNFLLPNYQVGEAVNSRLGPKALHRGVKLRGIVLDPAGFEADFRSRVESPTASHDNRLLIRDAREVANLPAYYSENLGLGPAMRSYLQLKYSRVGLSFGLWLFSDIAFIEPFHFGKRRSVPHLCGFSQLSLAADTEEFDLAEKHFEVLWEQAEFVSWCKRRGSD